MKKIHEKSPCCRGKIRRFGRRRRQCIVCRRTWRAWKKKRGRKPIRQNFNLLFKYLDNCNGSLERYAQKRNINPATLRARIRLALKKFIAKTPWPDVPKGPLIAVADALNQTINRETCTVYFILLRSLHSQEAVITPPLIHQGSESGTKGWYFAFNRLPKGVRKRIIGLVCDGRRPLVSLAGKEKWILQRCQFHLLYRIANYVRTGPLSRSRRIGLKVRSLVNIILTSPNEEVVKRSLSRLALLNLTHQSRGLRLVLSRLIKNYSAFRSYLYFPEINLPTTSNSVESLIGKVRNLQHRAKGFRSTKSLSQWIEALCKYQKTITCNGYKNQPN